ncbi:tRNA1(Val) A37 N6-methylase TrmN6 (TrmN6) [Commensalibacter communis]|uniref:tRNA1(Val) (adenine(37)-N6)-methyltransferase n=1 Tax=Commensalibacter communis TaxID=2972786 RepID=UPI0022FFB0BC|nr:methyltransferase [Commensalibacter communis]CAI3924960.1 tRNA1(Val) A37 N6-methylase TrmN6 (TrmN6) [Commensalibacter communis]CAI3934400.1 tRNA1(Val) A37 N6-methylase TrmN6 (TrmN6) [Commensalibacter communis]
MQSLSSSSSFIHHKSKKTSDGTLLGGKIFYRQYQEGYRTALEPILMAASIPAKPGQTIIEGGCGAGAGLMCLNYRVPNITGIGFEQNPKMLTLANENFQLNHMNSLKVVEVTLPKLPKRPFDFLSKGQEHVDHVFANPPWHAHNSFPSPNPQKDLAKRLPKDCLAEWIYALSRPLRQGGTLTLALSASLYVEASAIMNQYKLGSIVLFPLWPKLNRSSRIILLQGRMGSTGGSQISPGMILHNENGDFTTQANHILRDGQMLCLLP